MGNIIGRVKHETLNKLFELGHLPNPEKLTDNVVAYMNKYNKWISNKENSILISFFKNKKSKVRKYYNPSEFIKDIRNKKTEPYAEELAIVDYWYKIQDIRTVLEVRCVAKNSQSNNVMADKNTLLAIQRVLDNPEEYLSL